MNHYHAAEIAGPNGEATGRFRYVCSNKRTGTYAVGYCQADPENNGGVCPGHDSKEGAYQHYKDYLLDKSLFFNANEDGNQQRKCDECGEWTTGYADVRQAMFNLDLCAEHRTRGVVAKHFEVHESWGTI